MLRRTSHRVEPGPWPESARRTRVLVENPDRAVQWAYAAALDEAGYDVETCGGPGSADGEPVRCPLLEGRHCLLVDGADVVVSSCDLPRSHDILARLTATGAPSVVFEAPAPALERYSGVAGDAILLAVPATDQTLTAAVGKALARRLYR